MNSDERPELSEHPGEIGASPRERESQSKSEHELKTVAERGLLTSVEVATWTIAPSTASSMSVDLGLSHCRAVGSRHSDSVISSNPSVLRRAILSCRIVHQPSWRVT